MFVVLRKEAAMFKLQTYIELLYSLKWTIMLGLMRQTKHFLLMFVLWWAWWELTLGPDPMAPRCSWSGQWAVGSAPGCWVLTAQSHVQPHLWDPASGNEPRRWNTWWCAAFREHPVPRQHGAAWRSTRHGALPALGTLIGKALTKCLSSQFSSAIQILSSCRSGSSLGREGWRQDWHCAEVAEGESKDQKCLLSYGLLKNTAFIWA